jgi:hypothetical protein
MQFPQVPRFILAIAACAAFLSAQEPPAPAKPVKDPGMPGLPPRAAPTDYQAHAKVGAYNIGAEFAGHGVPTVEATYNTEEYVVIEVGLFGAPEAHLQISLDDFSLRINGKKPLSTVPFGRVLMNVKDPEWSPPDSGEKKSKGGLNTGGGGDSGSPPPIVHMPMELQHAMAQRVQKAVLPLGDRVVPQAGLIFFPYRGQEKKITTIELDYEGPAGKATLKLHPGH